MEKLGYKHHTTDSCVWTIADLGRYFVNIDDEIRSIDNPDNYFNFFLNKNERINRRQRFEFDSKSTGNCVIQEVREC